MLKSSSFCTHVRMYVRLMLVSNNLELYITCSVRPCGEDSWVHWPAGFLDRGGVVHVWVSLFNFEVRMRIHGCASMILPGQEVIGGRLARATDATHSSFRLARPSPPVAAARCP